MIPIEAIISYLTSHIVEWLFGAATTLALFGYHRISRSIKEQKEKNDAIAEGMQALLRENIIQSYNHYKEKGYCPIYAKESIRRMYQPYHKLDGNDVATKLKDELLAMQTEKEVPSYDTN